MGGRDEWGQNNVTVPWENRIKKEAKIVPGSWVGIGKAIGSMNQNKSREGGKSRERK